MADAPVNAFTETTSVISTDLFYISRSPHATGDDRKITGANLAEFVEDEVVANIVGGSNISVTGTGPVIVAFTGTVPASTADLPDASGFRYFYGLSGDVTVTAGAGPGAAAATIANDAVSNAKLANVATQTIKGRTTAGTGDPEDLTAAQATAILNTFTDVAKGLVPASGGGTTNFLRADGVFAAPSGGGGGGIAASFVAALTLGV